MTIISSSPPTFIFAIVAPRVDHRQPGDVMWSPSMAKFKLGAVDKWGWGWKEESGVVVLYVGFDGRDLLGISLKKNSICFSFFPTASFFFFLKKKKFLSYAVSINLALNLNFTDSLSFSGEFESFETLQPVWLTCDEKALVSMIPLGGTSEGQSIFRMGPGSYNQWAVLNKMF